MHLTVVITDCNPDSNSDFEKPEDRANKRLHNGRATAPVSRSVVPQQCLKKQLTS